jgi:hypothetical protein
MMEPLFCGFLKWSILPPVYWWNWRNYRMKKLVMEPPQWYAVSLKLAGGGYNRVQLLSNWFGYNCEYVLRSY